jgi:hypothetical protein
MRKRSSDEQIVRMVGDSRVNGVPVTAKKHGERLQVFICYPIIVSESENRLDFIVRSPSTTRTTMARRSPMPT